MKLRQVPWGRASVALLVVLLFTPLVSALSGLASSNPYAGHVVFVPMFAALLLWIERRRFRFTAERRAAGLSVAALAAIVGGVAYANGNVPLYAVSFVGAMAGLFLSFFGRGVRAAVFPLGLLLLMVPPPPDAMTAVALEIQHFVATSSGLILSGFGIPVAQDGISLHLPGLTLIVAEQCSGLRFLLILSVFAVALARMVLGSPSSQVTLVMLSVPIAVLANVTRVSTTGVGAYAIGPEVATGQLHHYIGRACWGAALVATIALAVWLRSRTTVSVPARHSGAGGYVASVS